MASKQQITQNIRDVNDAWTRLQTLFNSSLYGWTGNLYEYAQVLKTRRRF